MSQIVRLDASSARKISAGQVITSIPSVLKELVENSMDAKASTVSIMLHNSGLDLISVEDDGTGMLMPNLQSDGTLAEGMSCPLLAHRATTKYSNERPDELAVTRQESLGFRGEALHSLAHLSSVTVHTMTADQRVAVQLTYDAVSNTTHVAPSTVRTTVGTTVIVEGLFSNLPVRRRELEKNRKKQLNATIALVKQYSLPHPAIKVVLAHQEVPRVSPITTLITTSGSGDVQRSIAEAYGGRCIANMSPVQWELTHGKVVGYVSKAGSGRMIDDLQVFALDGRLVDLPRWAKAISDAFMECLPNAAQRVNPAFFLSITTNSQAVYDVNLAPNKRKVLMEEETKNADELRRAALGTFKSSSESIQIDTQTRRAQIERESILINQRMKMALTSVSATSFTQLTYNSSQAAQFVAMRDKYGGLQSEPEATQVGVADSDVGGGVESKVARTSRGDQQSTKPTGWVRDMYADGSGASEEPSTQSQLSFPQSTVGRTDIELRSTPSEGQTLIDAKGSDHEGTQSQRDTRCPQNIEDESIQKPCNGVDISEGTLEECTKRDSEGARRMSRNGASSSPSVSVLSDDDDDDDGCNFTLDNVKEERMQADPIEEEPDVLVLTDAGNQKRQLGPVYHFDFSELSTMAMQKLPSCATKRMESELGEWMSAEGDSAQGPGAGLNGTSPSPSKQSKAGRGGKKRARGNDGLNLSGQTEKELGMRLRKTSFSAMRIHGQFNHGFIMASLGDDMFVIDQHAADEKYNYEQLMNKYVARAQPLVVPAPVSMEPYEVDLAVEHAKELHHHGFLVRHGDGANVLLVSSVPVLPYDTVGPQDVVELIEQIVKYGNVVKPLRSVWHSMATKACRTSIMIGSPLSERTMSDVVTHLGTLDQPWNCPHGRPTLRHVGKVSSMIPLLENNTTTK